MQYSALSQGITLHFGEFALDIRAGELHKSGNKVRLQEQPFQLLKVLLEHPGEVVTREELRKRLWPEHTFVDFEHSLNAAVKRLRDTLNDSADNPRFIETIPRHGYRFIALVENGAVRATPRPGPRRMAYVLLIALGLSAVLAAFHTDRIRARLLGKPASGEIRSIAVLPLKNLSADPEQEYFADGMTDALITRLGSVSALRVISRTSIMSYKGTTKSLQDIARELKVDAVVEGTVLRLDDRIRMTVSLVQAFPENHLLAESYEGESKDTLSLQNKITQAVAAEVSAKLTPREFQRLDSTRPVNPMAQEAYLRGRYFFAKRTAEGLRKSIEYYDQAIEKDANYASAYAALAESLLLFTGYGHVNGTETYPKAKMAALRAVELDDNLPESHMVMGLLKETDWDWPGAGKEYRRAIELNPNSVRVHQLYSEYLILMGNRDEGIAQIERARELDPLSLIINVNVGTTLYYARQYDRAIGECRKVLELEPDFAPVYDCLGRAYEMKGQLEEAIHAYQKGVELSGSDPLKIAALGHAYAVSGKKANARKTLRELTALSLHQYVSPYAMAMVHAGLGERAQALEWLEKGCREHSSGMEEITIDSAFDSLRSEPRFQELLRRMHF